MSEARRICTEKGARLTPLREQVLELVWQSHRPLGAYDILDILNGEGRRSAPPTVYRTLDFLLQIGLVHRIASLNAFVGCNQPDHRHTGCFLICRECHNVLELEATGIQQAIDREARSHGFRREETVAEVTGLCPACGEADDRD